MNLIKMQTFKALVKELVYKMDNTGVWYFSTLFLDAFDLISFWSRICKDFVNVKTKFYFL